MKIQFVMRTVNENRDSCDASYGDAVGKKACLAAFEKFLDAHGTKVNDFEEFHCRFVPEEDPRQQKLKL